MISRPVHPRSSWPRVMSEYEGGEELFDNQTCKNTMDRTENRMSQQATFGSQEDDCCFIHICICSKRGKREVGRKRETWSARQREGRFFFFVGFTPQKSQHGWCWYNALKSVFKKLMVKNHSSTSHYIYALSCNKIWKSCNIKYKWTQWTHSWSYCAQYNGAFFIILIKLSLKSFI